MTLTTQEKLFLKRAALKIVRNPDLTPVQAMRLVCEDDQRIFETVITMPSKQRAAFDHALSSAIYHSIPGHGKG